MVLLFADIFLFRAKILVKLKDRINLTFESKV